MQKLTSEELVAKLHEKLGDTLLEAYETYGLVNIHIPADSNIEVMQLLKEDKELNFHFLTDLTGIHYPFNKGQEVGVVYMVHNMMANIRLRVKAFMPADNTNIRSLTRLWDAANWMERETYDFFGIVFEGHPDLRRILNVDEMDYFPLLKQYPLEDATREDKDDTMFGR
jgi:NADH-quinone oxidoreductase subunit C